MADAGLPLLAAALDIPAIPLSSTVWETAGDLQVLGGTQGTDWKYTAGNVQVNGANYGTSNVLEILSSTPLTVKNADGKATSTTTIQIDAGVKADLTLAGVKISSATAAPINMITNADEDGDGVKVRNAADIKNKTTLYLTLADGTTNTLENTRRCGPLANMSGGWPAIRCGWGSVLVIDDSVTNVRAGGSKFNLNDIVTPQNGAVPADTRLLNGKAVKQGDPLSVMESGNPGKLIAQAGSQSAGVGSAIKENAGTLIFNGGVIDVKTVPWVTWTNYQEGESSSAAIGGASGGSGTITTINGGHLTVTGGSCGSGIGCGASFTLNSTHNDGTPKPDAIAVPLDGTDKYAYGYTWYGVCPRPSVNTLYPTLAQIQSVAGDITINGGLTKITAPVHGNAVGQSCQHGVNSNYRHIIRVTGGTLLTTVPSASSTDPYMYSIGASHGYTIVTGGSVQVQNRPGTTTPMFQGIGNTAYNTQGIIEWSDVTAAGGSLPDADKVFMITINLAKEIEERNKTAGIGNDPNLDDRIKSWKLLVGGKEYAYGAPDQFHNGELYLWLPKSATNKEITVDLSYTDKNGDEQVIEPLFRDPVNGATGNTLKRYVSFDLPDDIQTSKYYDGTPLKGLTIGKGTSIRASDNKDLDDGSFVTYKYQLYDKVGGTSVGVESASAKEMPSDAGVMKLTVDSNQYSKGDPDGFGKSYWGHRANGWCEIKPTTSKINLVSANWEDNKPGSVMETAYQRLTVHATVKPGDKDPDGKPNGPKCQAPRGYIQIFVDGKAAGTPVKLVFEGDLDEKGQPVPKGDGRINAVAVPNGDGSFTNFSYSFIPAKNDALLPTATGDNHHEVSVQYLPPALGEAAPANYLASANPTEVPDVPKAEVVVKPVDPETSIEGEPDPEAPEGAPEPKVEIGTTPTPTDPSPEKHPTEDPVYPGDKTYEGYIETVYDEPSEENPHPGRVILKVESESSGDISVVDDAGNPFTASITPNGDGTWTVVLDPTRVGNGDLHIVQKPNGAFTGTHWDITVVVKPNPKIPPKTSVSKSVENLTHPQGPTQPGDRLRYTIKAENTAKGSGWLGVVLTDALPAALELDASTVHLKNPSEKFDKGLKAGASDKLGEYELSAPGTDGRPVLTAMVGDVGGVGDAALTFECTVKGDAASPQGTADITNTAKATGSRPDPDNPDGDPLPENPDPTGPVAPPGGGKVAPADPDVKISKSVENTTNPGSKMTKVGDVLRYTIELRNAGASASCLLNAVISDPMPAGIEPVPGTMRMALPDGSTVSVPDSAYDKASRTIAVTAGDLWGGKRATLTFDATATETALGEDAANVAFAHGTIPSSEPGPGSQPTGGEPGKPTSVPPAGDEPVGSTPPATPPIVVGDDPEGGQLSIEKTAENKSRSDGTTHVGDKVRYTIVLRNDGPATSWMDAVVRDVVPKGLDPVAGSIRMTLPDGKKVKVADDAYKPGTRTLSVAAGHLHGGRQVTLAFTAKVTEDAVGSDIGNVAIAYGLPPSKWDPDGAHPQPGTPFDPPEGWGTYAHTHEQIDSPAAYPPGVTADGGVIDDSEDPDVTDVIGGIKLAQTGDPNTLLATGLTALAALAAAVMAIARRRIRG